MYALSKASMLGSSSATSTNVSSFLGDMILLSRRRRIRNQVALTVKLCLGPLAADAVRDARRRRRKAALGPAERRPPAVLATARGAPPKARRDAQQGPFEPHCFSRAAPLTLERRPRWPLAGSLRGC